MDPLKIITNRKFIDIDTYQSVDNYINEICADPGFLCKSEEHKKVCGENASFYTGVKNVKDICNSIKEANVCENDIKECIVLADNTFDDSQRYVSTSFSNIIIPIPKAFDNDGHQKFIRLPALSASKKKNSNEICSVCACMHRFATSPGSGVNDYTSPGQNGCVFGDNFEYYYYPLYVQQIRTGLKDTPPVTVGVNGKYIVLNTNIIAINTEDGLSTVNLYNSLVKNGISQGVAKSFITEVLYKKDEQAKKELELNLIKNSKSKFSNNISRFGNSFNNNLFFYLILIGLILFLLIQLKNN